MTECDVVIGGGPTGRRWRSCGRDSATFVDPLFSKGVCLETASAVHSRTRIVPARETWWLLEQPESEPLEVVVDRRAAVGAA